MLIPSFNISKTLFSLSLVFFLGLSSAKVSSKPLSYDCPNTTTYAPNSTYQSNLNNLFSVLSSNANAINGFYNFTAGHSPPDIAYGLFLCRGDLSTDVCQDCVVTATKEAVQLCPNQKMATIWYDNCLLRFSNKSIFSYVDQSIGVQLGNPQSVTDPTSFEEVLAGLMNDTATRASDSQSGKKFATGQANSSSLQTLYGLAQCTPDIPSSGCNSCLRDAISSLATCCDGKRGGGAKNLFPSCIVRYELYPFYNTTAATAPPPPPSPVLLPPTPPPGKGGISSQVLIAIIVPIGVSVLLFIISFCFLRRKTKKKHGTIAKDNGKC